MSNIVSSERKKKRRHRDKHRSNAEVGGNNPINTTAPPRQEVTRSKAISSVRYQSLDDLDDDDKEMFDILANPKKRMSNMNSQESFVNETTGGTGGTGETSNNDMLESDNMARRSSKDLGGGVSLVDNRRTPAPMSQKSPLVSPRINSPPSPHSPSVKDFPQLDRIDNSVWNDNSQQWKEGPDAGYMMSPQEEIKRKQELLEGFDKLARKGVRIHRMFDMNSSLEEMDSEYQRLVRQRELEQSIRFQRRLLLTCVTGVEMFNKKYDPFEVELDGWSEVVYSEIDSYDDIFEELYEKYHTKVKMAPELRLLFALGGSAVMFHISNTMLQTSMPGMQMNPQMMQNIASRMQSMGKQGGVAPPEAGGMNGMGGMGGMRGPAPSVNKGVNGEQPRMR